MQYEIGVAGDGTSREKEAIRRGRSDDVPSRRSQNRKSQAGAGMEGDDLLDRLEAENIKLRQDAIGLVIQIQELRERRT